MPHAWRAPESHENTIGIQVMVMVKKPVRNDEQGTLNNEQKR
jgi:hypothetical protein